MAGNNKKLSSGLIAAGAVFALLLLVFLVNQFGGTPPEEAQPETALQDETPEIPETPEVPEETASIDSRSEDILEEEEPLNWYDVIDGQWRYSFEEDIEMRINFYNRSFFRTQAVPPETSVSRSGSWRFLGEDDDSVAVRLLIVGSSETEVLHLTYVDDKTLEGRYNSSPPGETTMFTKVIHQ